METDTAAPKAESAPNYAPVVTTESREIGRPIAFDGDKLASSQRVGGPVPFHAGIIG